MSGVRVPSPTLQTPLAATFLQSRFVRLPTAIRGMPCATDPEEMLMDLAESDSRLERISTLWTVINQARDGSPPEVADAHAQLLLRYGSAINRYLRGALRNADAVDELAQEFALRLIRGDFRGADQQRGRFRDFLKGVLAHLIADYLRRRRPVSLQQGSAEPAAANASPEQLEQEFL